MRTRSNNRELWLSLIAVLCVTGAYLSTVIWFKQIPAASGFVGHSIGILGFIMMLMTETLYSVRKRRRGAQWGRMADWLDFHIFTGITGPYMVLLHSSWKFNGLAGAVMLITIIVVISGFFGRYIYTSIPRNVDGIEIEVSALEAEIAKADTVLKRLSAHRGNYANAPVILDERPDSIKRNTAKEIKELRKRRDRLSRQVASLAMTRRLFALWHAVHIPLGLTLFIAAFIHIIGAIYYATLLR